jgi:serine phosphatase RsbU (regulator of sigma subunit)
MARQTDLLKEKAALLIARERELLTLRKFHDRQAAWLAFTRELPELVPADTALSKVCADMRERIIPLLNVQCVAFFELGDSGPLSPFLGALELAPASPALSPAVRALLHDEPGGLIDSADDEPHRGLAAAVGLERFIWVRIDRHAECPLLMVAGFDRDKASLNPRFGVSDVQHFLNIGRDLDLLLRNIRLVRELSREKEKLERLNSELEQRVEARTMDLARANDELASALGQLRNREARLAEDIEQAHRFQRKILPQLPLSDAIDFGAVYLPVERVGGDLYDVSQLSAGKFRIFLADATGHGVQAAMRTIFLKAEYDRIKTMDIGPHGVLERLTRRLLGLFPGGDMMSTACCLDVEVDGTGARVSYSNAAHPPLLIWRNGVVHERYAEGPFLGLVESQWPAPDEFLLERDDLLLLYTDGLIDQRNVERASFESELRQLRDEARISAHERLLFLMERFDQFRGDVPMLDDVSAVALRILGTRPTTPASRRWDP